MLPTIKVCEMDNLGLMRGLVSETWNRPSPCPGALLAHTADCSSSIYLFILALHTDFSCRYVKMATHCYFKQASKTSTHPSIIAFFLSIIPTASQVSGKGLHSLFKGPPSIPLSSNFSVLLWILFSIWHWKPFCISSYPLRELLLNRICRLFIQICIFPSHLLYCIYTTIYMYSTCTEWIQYPMHASLFLFKNLFLTLCQDLLIKLLARARILHQVGDPYQLSTTSP